MTEVFVCDDWAEADGAPQIAVVVRNGKAPEHWHWVTAHEQGRASFQKLYTYDDAADCPFCEVGAQTCGCDGPDCPGFVLAQETVGEWHL